MSAFGDFLAISPVTNSLTTETVGWFTVDVYLRNIFARMYKKHHENDFSGVI